MKTQWVEYPTQEPLVLFQSLYCGAFRVNSSTDSRHSDFLHMLTQEDREGEKQTPPAV